MVICAVLVQKLCTKLWYKLCTNRCTMRIRMDMSYLMLRGDVWWYNRRIPAKYAHLDTRKRIRKSLDTYAPISEMPSVLDEASLSCCGSLALGFLADITVE